MTQRTAAEQRETHAKVTQEIERQVTKSVEHMKEFLKDSASKTSATKGGLKEPPATLTFVSTPQPTNKQPKTPKTPHVKPAPNRKSQCNPRNVKKSEVR
jgi:hypothetical protein